MATLETESDEPVVFLLNGEEVSNDPRWFAAKQQEQVQAAQEAAKPAPSGYAAMKPADLKAIATGRSLDLAGITKKSQLVKLLEDADAAAVAEGGAAAEDDDEE